MSSVSLKRLGFETPNGGLSIPDGDEYAVGCGIDQLVLEKFGAVVQHVDSGGSGAPYMLPPSVVVPVRGRAMVGGLLPTRSHHVYCKTLEVGE
jgi:hypothetical protein